MRCDCSSGRRARRATARAWRQALEAQARAFVAPPARLGALWMLAAHLEAHPDAQPDAQLRADERLAVVERIRVESPDDRAAIDAFVGAAWERVRAGDEAARGSLVRALEQRATSASDDTERLWAVLASALLRGDGDERSALAAFREALRIDPTSVVAANETARLAARLSDAEATVTAALSRAELAPNGRVRAALLVQAAGQMLATLDARLGTRPERLTRAAALLERALACDPEAIAAIGLLTAVRAEDGGRDRLLATLRDAFDRATSPHVVGTLGLEVARAASQEPADRVLAIEALRRVLALEPEHPPTLRALADQYLAQGARAEATAALEAFCTHARDPGARIAALFELAELHAAVPGHAGDMVRVLRAALDIDPLQIAALRRRRRSRIC
jgi:tetratricopeptide (TPR) repeat protein